AVSSREVRRCGDRLGDGHLETRVCLAWPLQLGLAGGVQPRWDTPGHLQCRWYGANLGRTAQQYGAFHIGGPQRVGFDVKFSPEGDRLATASYDGTARLWDATNGSQSVKLAGHTDRLFSVAWSPDGTHIATDSADGTARVWDSATGR